jgi:uncharacterized metal-binding protein YceD (DUF177 family)
MTQTQRPWTVPVRIEDVPEEGTHFDLSADEKTRATIASMAGLRVLSRLQASLDVRRHGQGGLRVTGEVSATVGQVCVVTLDPLENEIQEAVDLTFMPGAGAPQSGADVDPAAEEPPEAMVEGTIDLGALATEFLILGIDPYPRRPGAVFESTSVGEASANPFAALAKLKHKQDPDTK